MDKSALSNKYTFEFEDGDTCEMTLTFIALKRLSGVNKSLYERCQKVMAHGAKDELDTLTVLYSAYVCANIHNEVMTEDEFIEKCGSDRHAVMDALSALITEKKRKASADHSN